MVGSQVALPADGQTYTLYYLFPLRRGAGDARRWSRGRCSPRPCCCWCWSPGMTWLVTRQVVTPIRLARRVAERLAAGQLQERLRVSGEDDLARLATSFNQMATNLQRQIRQLEELSRVQRRFVSDVSHELRTPLTTVRMAGDVLHDARERVRPGDRPRRRAAADRAGPVRDAARRPARDQPVRRRRRRARRSTTSTWSTSPTGSSTRPRPLADQRGVQVVVQAPSIPAWPRPTYAGSSGSCATWSPTRSTTPTDRRHRRPRGRRRPRGGDRRPRLRRRARRRARRRWCSTGSGGPTRPAPAPAAAPASGCRSRSRTPTCTAAGCRRGAGRARARSSG